MKHAFVVDDNPQILALARRWLGSAGYDVSTSEDFMEAKLRLQTGTLPEALVVDVRLDGFNGLQLAILARESDPDVHIVVISAWNDPVLQREAAGFGAKYICKPFSASQLLDALEEPVGDDASSPLAGGGEATH